MVERRARKRGIPVIYVNPAYTSTRCCRCGEFGRRFQKRFECPHCRFVQHADVNAAFNIAKTPLRCVSMEYLSEPEDMRAFLLSKKQMRRIAKAEVRHKLIHSPAPAVSVIAVMANQENLLAVLE